MPELFKAGVTITPEELQTCARKFQKELLMMPMLSLQKAFLVMSSRICAGKATVGQLDGDIELGPYSETRVDENGITIAGRTIETYLGNVTKNFSPNSLAQTIWAPSVLKGEQLTKSEIVKRIMIFLSAKLGQNLYKSLWSAKRNDAGDKTKDLFDGFDTITAKEITSGAIATGKGNLFNLTEAINSTNAVDSLNAIYEASDDVLQDENCLLYVPTHAYRDYCKDYKTTTGAVPYNKQYEQIILEGSGGRCKIVPMSCKKDSPYIHLTTKQNMLIGYAKDNPQQLISAEKHSGWVVQFLAACFFGTQMETISKERLLVATIDGTTAI